MTALKFLKIEAYKLSWLILVWLGSLKILKFYIYLF